MRENELRELVARILMIPPEQVVARTSLSSLDNSLGEAKLRLGLKRLGLGIPGGLRPATFGELSSLLAAEPSPASPVSAAMGGQSPLPAPGPRVGLDLQEINALPSTDDYWAHSFYAGSFAKSEIAYAIAKAEPRVHFAGFWSAKEALRKCDDRFLHVDPTETAVEHDARGRPSFTWKNSGGVQRLPHSLSISHSAGIAMAIVMAIFP